MSTTAKDLIQAAAASRTANDPDKLWTPAELIGVVGRKVRSLYSRASRVNPWYFSKVTNVTPDGTVWALPTDAIVPLHFYGGGDAGTGAAAVLGGGTDPDADEVSLVLINDLDAELAPRVYQLGRSLYSPGGASDPSASVNGDKLNIVHSFMHAALDATAAWDAAANTLDASWPEHFNDLLILRLQRYIALKDGRQGDIEGIEDEYALVLADFDQELEDALTARSARHSS